MATAEIETPAAATYKRPAFKEKYGNFIGGKFVEPVGGQYFENVSPIDGKVFTQVARSGKEDMELALDAAHAAFETWGKTSATLRSNVLLKIADMMEAEPGVPGPLRLH